MGRTAVPLVMELRVEGEGGSPDTSGGPLKEDLMRNTTLDLGAR